MGTTVTLEDYQALEAKCETKLEALISMHSEEIEMLNAAYVEDVNRMTEQLEVLKGAVALLTTELEALKASQNKNSKNSNKPPSSDGLKKAPVTKSLRKKTGRRPGYLRCYTHQLSVNRNSPERVADLKIWQ